MDKSIALKTDQGTLYKDDCLKVMKKLPSESIDCFFADPPFNLNKFYGEGVNDAIPEDEYERWCEKWADEGVRLLKPGGSFFVYNLPRWNMLLAAHLSKKLTFKHWVAIELTFSLPIAGRLYPSHYSLLYFTKGPKANTFTPPRLPIQVCRHCGGEIKDYGGYKSKMNPKGISLSDVWTDIPPVRHKKFKNREANALSLKLMTRIIDMSTKPGDTVFDPFGGSGTTYVAAELRGRKWIGTELSTTDAIAERFAKLDIDRGHLEELDLRTNVLFTPEALALRKKHGKSNDKYRPHVHEPVQQSSLL
jgi:site-specific DNA-methyltransferase (adenine-specific)